jgi:RNA polymerase sigma-70 factor (ECF subfamily)
MTSAASASRQRAGPPAGGQLRTLAFRGDDAALVAGLRRGHPAAAAAFHDRFAARMHRLLFRLLGPDPELADVLHDAFVRALEALPKLRDPGALDSWVMGVTVRTARTCIQRRARRRWLRIMPAEELPDMVAVSCDPAMRECLRATYQLLENLPTDERIALVLRFAAGMTIAEAAEACKVSVSTIKRRLHKGQKSFLEGARQQPALRAWLAGGTA